MVHLVVSVTPAVGRSGRTSFHNNITWFIVCPERAKAIANGAIAIPDRGWKFIECEIHVSAMAGELDQSKFLNYMIRH